MLVDARFILPEHLVVIRGETTWSGSVKALEDHVMWVDVLSNKSGKIYLTPEIPPVVTSFTSRAWLSLELYIPTALSWLFNC